MVIKMISSSNHQWLFSMIKMTKLTFLVLIFEKSHQWLFWSIFLDSDFFGVKWKIFSDKGWNWSEKVADLCNRRFTLGFTYLGLGYYFLLKNFIRRLLVLFIETEDASVFVNLMLLSGSLANSNIRNKNILISHKHKLIP